jgi:phosphatidylethanolamine/phosphatidyl-N-methylethanolamine N-methyltransferase
VSALNDTCQFLKVWLRRPLTIGTVMPSGQALARAIAHQVPLPTTLPILELGAGTGAITAALLDAGVPPDRLIAVEREEALFATLTKRFPGIKAIRGDATRLQDLLRTHGVTQVGAVVSGLPLVSLPAAVCHAIVEQSLKVMAPGAPFVQFTYAMASPIDCRAHGLDGRRIGYVWANFPPANIWVYRRQGEAAVG